MHTLAHILHDEGIRGTFYLTTDFLDTPGHLTSTQASSIRHMGHMIGGHTLDHPNITTLSTLELRDQICTSKQVLEELAWFPVMTFAYPYGAGGKVAAIVQELKRAGYIAARGTDKGFNTRTTNPYDLLSFSFHKSIAITSMQSKAAEAAANNWWIIYTVHHINVPTEAWNVSASDLRSLITYAQSLNMRFVTVEEGARLLLDNLGK
jgi:peptidoglycan/xylan/chitin deacetylase (PgdA/CDA1 family)